MADTKPIKRKAFKKRKKKRLGFSPLGSGPATSLARDVGTKSSICSRELNGNKSHQGLVKRQKSSSEKPQS